jgi:hypothetical protein
MEAPHRQLHFLLPTDERAGVWDMPVDFTSTAKQLSEALVPSSQPESQPFFTEACRALLAGLKAESHDPFDETAPDSSTPR